MGKYSPLREYLADQDKEQVPLTFTEIERILAFPLPSSKQYPAWWSNNPSNNPMTREWIEAGFETESVNTTSGKLVFRRKRKGGPTAGSAELGSTASEKVRQGRHPGFGFMKGLIKVQEGFDVTKPFDDEPWDNNYSGQGPHT